MPEPLPRVITRAEAIARGLSTHAVDRRVAAGRWRRVLPRTYVTTDTMTERDRYAAALAFAGRGAALSGAAALRVSQIGRIAHPGRALVLVPPANRTQSSGWVHVRRTFRPIEFEPRPGLRRVAAPRAVADHALTLRRGAGARNWPTGPGAAVRCCAKHWPK